MNAMRKIFPVIVLTVMATTVMAQSHLTTVRGKTKEGKTIKVEYYKGSVEDYVESVKYQLVDELQARVNDLQEKLDAANKQIKDLNKGGGQTKQISELNGQILVLNERIKSLNRELSEKNISYDSIVTVNNGLVNSLLECEKQVEQLQQEVVRLNLAVVGHPQPTAVFGATLGVGPVLAKGVEEGWASDVNWVKKVEVYFGTASLSYSFPISIEAGVGIRSFAFSASRTPYEYVESGIDADGDSFQAMYSFGTLQERLSLTYLDIPVRACFGQPGKDHVGVYAKIGVTPSVKIADKFQGSGTYTLKGYYPQWDVTLENISELGFGSDLEYYTDVNEPEVNAFVVWGNAILGAYVPFKGTHLLLNAGLGLDVPLMNLAKTNAGKRAVMPSFEIGLVYTLK